MHRSRILQALRIQALYHYIFQYNNVQDPIDYKTTAPTMNAGSNEPPFLIINPAPIERTEKFDARTVGMTPAFTIESVKSKNTAISGFSVSNISNTKLG